MDFLNITSFSDAGELANVLDAAVAVVEGELCAPIEPGEFTDTFDPGTPVLVLSHAPVSSVTSITGSSSLTPLAVPADAIVDLPSGIIRLTAPFTRWHGAITVTYTTGDTISPAVQLAVFIVAGHLWETQRGAASLPSPGMDATPMMSSGDYGYAMPNRAKELLAPFVRGPRV